VPYALSVSLFGISLPVFGGGNRSCSYWVRQNIPVPKMKIPNRNQNVYFVFWMHMKSYTTAVINGAVSEDDF
jgi:hypothetical protein